MRKMFLAENPFAIDQKQWMDLISVNIISRYVVYANEWKTINLMVPVPSFQAHIFRNFDIDEV